MGGKIVLFGRGNGGACIFTGDIGTECFLLFRIEAHVWGSPRSMDLKFELLAEVWMSKLQ